MTTAICRVTGTGLTAYAQRVFVPIVIDCIPWTPSRLGVRLS